MIMKAAKEIIITGIDPAGKSAGVAHRFPGESRLESYTVRDVLEPKNDNVCWIEVPQNGTHESRAGVMFAAGVLYALNAYGSRIQFVTPSVWREAIYGDRDPEDPKQLAFDFCEKMGHVVESHDEAESVAILCAGEKLGVRKTRYVRKAKTGR